MRDYFEEETPLVSEASLPVKPNKAEWVYEKDPDIRLSSTFEFKTADAYAHFLSEIASLEKGMGHHGQLACKYPEVSIVVRTDSLDTVTKRDVTYAKKVTQIFKDAKKLEDLT